MSDPKGIRSRGFSSLEELLHFANFELLPLLRQLKAGATGGTGDFSGPASATDGDIVIFDGVTGKLGKDTGASIASLEGYTDSHVAAGVATAEAYTDAQIAAGAVPPARTLTAGAGLTGGGTLAADRTFDVVANADGSIVVNTNDVQVGVLATDAQHGVRGGGTQHAVAIAGGAAGFLSGTDKTKLDGITAGAAVASVSGTAPIASSGGTTPAISIAAASGAAAGSMSASDFTKLAGISAGADVTSAALVGAGTTTAAVAATANKLDLVPLSLGTITTGTTQPYSFTDATFAGYTAGGAAVGTGGTAGIVAGSFASSGAETGTGAGQGGLTSTAASNQPYNTSDFPGGRYRAALIKTNGEPVALLDTLTTANISYPLSVAAPVFLYLSYRSDLGANAKWRGFFYFTNQVTGLDTPFTPNASLSSVTVSAPYVALLQNMPTSAGYYGVAAAGAAEVEFGATSDIQPLGTAAGGSSGKVADAQHVHTMPSVDQLATCGGDASLNSNKLTNLAAGSAAGHSVRYEQVGLLDGTNAWGANQSMGSHKLTSVTDPTAAQDAATKNYVDSKQLLFWSWRGVGAQATTSTCWVPVSGNFSPSTAERRTWVVAPFAGTLLGMYVIHNPSFTDADTFAYTVQINSVDTSITATMASNGTAVNDTAHSAAFVAGDKIGIKTVQSSTTAQTQLEPCVVLFYKASA